MSKLDRGAVKTKEKLRVRIGARELLISNLDKRFWPEGWTKGDLINYYVKIAPYILPYLKDRPFVMSRYPDGIEGDYFYQKDCPSHAPAWVEKFPIRHEGSDKVVNYVLCNNVETLAWLASQGCIETHFWLAKIPHINKPDIAVFDLDPALPATFEDTLEVALLVRKALEQLGLKGFPKTSGATGLHIYVPLLPEYNYRDIRICVEFICKLIHKAYPERTTLERVVAQRTGKVYLDFLQNTMGKTMAGPYSLRPEPGAPVSTQLSWYELERGALKPGNFNIETIYKRLVNMGDIWEGFFALRQSFGEIRQMSTF